MTLRAIRLALLPGVAAIAALGCGWMYAEAPSLGIGNRTDGPVMESCPSQFTASRLVVRR